MEKYVTNKLGDIYLGTKCLFQIRGVSGGEEVYPLHIFSRFFPQTLQSWIGLGIALSKQQNKLITAHYICSYFQQVPGRWPSLRATWAFGHHLNVIQSDPHMLALFPLSGTTASIHTWPSLASPYGDPPSASAQPLLFLNSQLRDSDWISSLCY